MSKTSSDLRRLRRGGFDIENNIVCAPRIVPPVVEKGNEDAYPTIPWQSIFKWIRYAGYLIVLCTIIMRVSFVLVDKVARVDSIRSAEEAQLRQPCCRMFYITNEQEKWSQKDINDCIQILQKAKEKNKVNQCEEAKIVLGTTWWHQFAREVWIEIIPFSEMSFAQIVSSAMLSPYGASIFGFCFKQIAAEMGFPIIMSFPSTTTDQSQDKKEI
jgi:hypothetical protein